MLGGNAVSSPEALALAHRIAAATGARLMAQGSNGRLARGQGRVPVDRVPYVVDTAIKVLAGTRQMILVGARKPVTFFAYPNKPGTSVPPDADMHILARPDQDAAEALARLVEELGAPRAPLPDPGPRPTAGTRRPESPKRSPPPSPRCCRTTRSSSTKRSASAAASSR